MSTSTVTCSPNHFYDRSMLRIEIDDIFNQLVQKSYPYLKKYAFVCPLEVAHRKHGDYACFSILEVCSELRKDDPDLFDRKTPKDIAMDMMRRFQFAKIKMISQQSVTLRDDGIITFRLDGLWIAKRINMMLTDGMYSWAPKMFDRTVLAVFFQKVTRGTNANMLRASCIKDAIARMLSYSGIVVLDLSKYYDSSNNVSAYLENIRLGARRHGAHVIVFVIPHLHRECIQKSFDVARKKEIAQLVCCGYNTFRINERVKLALRQKFYDYFHSTSLHSLAGAAGYTADTSFSCILKYTSLKSCRLAEVTFDIGEMVDEEGNTFVNLLRTKALISSLIKFPRGRSGTPKQALAGKGEHELGLYLVEFTRTIEDAVKVFLPHIVCEYMFKLSKCFTSYYHEVQPGEPVSWLCKATEVVMDKCFDLLGIAPGQSFLFDVKGLSDVGRIFDVERYNGYITHSPSEARCSRLCSRFEMFSMNVAHSKFDEGDIFGTVFVIDALGARADGWIKSDAKDFRYVAYFNSGWPDSVAFANSSCIPFGDPSCRRSVPISSSVEIHVRLHATSKKKDQCYLIFHGMPVVPLTKFWHAEPKWKCGSLSLIGDDDTRVLMNYIILKDAVDTSMELTFDSHNSDVPLKVCGSIMAYYGDDVVKDDILGQYKAVIFRTTTSELIGNQVRLPLHKSALAVPANGCLKIEVFLTDVESKRVILHGMREYRARTDDADNWYIEYGEYSFNLKVAWSK